MMYLKTKNQIILYLDFLDLIKVGFFLLQQSMIVRIFILKLTFILPPQLNTYYYVFLLNKKYWQKVFCFILGFVFLYMELHL